MHVFPQRFSKENSRGHFWRGDTTCDHGKAQKVADGKASYEAPLESKSRDALDYYDKTSTEELFSLHTNMLKSSMVEQFRG